MPKSRKKLPDTSLNEPDRMEPIISSYLIKSENMRISQARKVLSDTNNPQKFEYRDSQIRMIENSIKELFSQCKQGRSRIIMLTGMPGAGKTLCANYVLRNSKYNTITLNTNHTRTKKDVQQFLIEKLLTPKENIHENAKSIKSNKGAQKSQQNHQKQDSQKVSSFQLIQMLQKASLPQTVLYIEEIELFFNSYVDQIYSDFFDIFNHPQIPILLLGVSNTIDALQKYGKKINVQVKDIMNIVFNPYSVQVVQKIIEEKLSEVKRCSGINIKINDRLLSFAANKMYDYKKGDLRIVFSFLKSLGEDVILPSLISQQINVSLEQINRAILTIKKTINSVLDTLPNSQKIALIAIYNCIKQNDSTHITAKQLQKQIKQIYQLINLKNNRTFKQQLEQLQIYGFIKIKVSKITNESRIIMGNIEVDEIKYAFDENELLSQFIRVASQ